jgi:hypothetical protein
MQPCIFNFCKQGKNLRLDDQKNFMEMLNDIKIRFYKDLEEILDTSKSKNGFDFYLDITTKLESFKKQFS